MTEAPVVAGTPSQPSRLRQHSRKYNDKTRQRQGAGTEELRAAGLTREQAHTQDGNAKRRTSILNADLVSMRVVSICGQEQRDVGE